MANEVLHKTGTAIVWTEIAEFADVPFTHNDAVQLNLGALANAAARQGDKVDLGATRARQYAVRIGIELDVDLAAAGTIDVYWSSSPSGTAATGNTGGASGAEGAYTVGTTVGLEQLMLIGVFPLKSGLLDDTCYQGVIGMFTPPERYGSPVVVNNSSQALEAAADTMYVALIPIVDEIQ
jgi:hypothetical protein